jgi:hypothetical protein
MAGKKTTGTTEKTVTTLLHDEASRKNIPTAEFQSVMRNEEQRPIRVAYQRRNRDLETSLARLAVDGFNPCAVVETSAGNFQAWLKHPRTFPKLLGTFAAQTLAERYDADPSAADWRRFGRLPGFTNCKPKYRKSDGLFPFVRLHSHSGQQYPMAEAFEQEITKLYEAQEQEREARRLESSLSPRRGPRLSNLSLERFRSSTRYQDRPAAADIAFCVAAFANGMTEDRIGFALEDDYLSRDPSPSKRAAYIRRTMEKARRWAER